MKIWGVKVYIINGHLTRNNLDDISNCGYFMVYAYTTGVILFCNKDQNFVIHIAYHVWFDEYNYCLSTEDKDTLGSLILQQDPEMHDHNSDLLKLIPYEIDIYIQSIS